jgi:acylphosphatase
MTICVRCVVSGKVQGVFFRAATRQQAVQLGIQGYAKNRLDGRVEVLACGEPRAISQLKAWLTKGPPAARVSGVACESMPAQTLQGFTTG